MQMGNVFKQDKPGAENLEARAVIVHMAQQLGAGQYASQLCPQCDGGATKERSLSLGIETNGVVKFYCHRGACGFQGFAYTTPGLQARPDSERPTAATHANSLTADLHQLSEKEFGYFRERYGIGSALASVNIRRTESRYAISIRGPNATVRGWITRRPWDGSPADTTPNRNDPQWSLKALTYMDNDEPVQSWYAPTGNVEDYDRGVYLVEDQLSAMRLVQYFEDNWGGTHVQACALLGTGLNASKVAEIQREARERTVHLALDKDATGHAFAMARKWGMAFTECRVIVLDKDIKDCSDKELTRLPL